MLSAISQWGHVFAAISFGILGVWQMRRPTQRRIVSPLSMAAGLTVIWALCFAVWGPHALIGWTAESVRDIGWLVYMHGLWQKGTRSERLNEGTTIRLLYGVTVFVLAGRICVDLLPLGLAGSPRLLDAAFYAGVLLRMLTTVSAIVLAHNLYSATVNNARSVIRLPMIALSLMWAYDLNLYTITYLAHQLPLLLVALRGPIVGLLAPLMALGAQRVRAAPVKLSRTATFQSLSLVGIGAYLMVMVGGSEILKLFGETYVRGFQVGFVFVTALMGLLVLPNARLRAWTRVMLAKHLFQHRYDYRAEWLRFTDTLGRQDSSAAALIERAIKAIADITESGGGALLVPELAGGLAVKARWNWPDMDVPSRAAEQDAVDFFLRTGRIVQFDSLRRDDTTEEEARAIPQWMISDTRIWIAVPLIHFDRLEGLVLLERPSFARTLDWEDFDLLRIAGRQVASYLAEAKGQEALSDAQRFDEFNRRFAFIMHDIKNLVSQLSLVSRNAERHIGNPAFQRDMLATLENSTRRMNDLLARLSQHNKGKVEETRNVVLGALVELVVAPKRQHHPVLISGDMTVSAAVDPARLEQALGHLVQNAIDASAPSDPVTVTISFDKQETLIHVHDTGCGMSPEYMREQLFKPFSSTKPGGFGIGAFEARELIASMGGRLSVNSHPGRGTQFTISIPHSHLDHQDVAA